MNTLLRLQLQKILKITPAQIDNLLTDNTVPDTGWANLTPEKLMELLRDVNQHYSHSDQEKLRLHRALEISTHESDILNESLRETNARLNHTLEELARMIREYRVHSRSAGMPDDRILLDSLGEILDENRALQREIETRRALLNILQDLETANREMDEKNRLLAKEIADRTRIEEALRENMEKYRKLFDEAQDAIIIADAETGEILSCNNATARLFGYEKEELIGRSQRVLHPFFDSSSLITKTFQQHLDEAEGQVLETQAITRNGEILEVAIKANLLDWHGRKVLQGIFHDITDQKRAQEELVRQNTELCAANEQLAATEAELKHKLEEIVSTHSTLSISMQALTESEEKYRQLADSISDVFFAMDNNLVYTYWNKASEQLMGVSAQDVIGKSHSDLFPEKGDLMAERHYQDAIQKQQPMSFVDSYRRGDSDYTLEINVYPTSRGISVFAKDITEHKLAEEAIHESEQRYRNVVEDQIEFISRFLPDGTHIFVNDAYCRYYGVAREQILGKRFRPVLYADDREAVTGFFATLTLKNPVGTIEHRIVMPDGNTRWQRWSDRAIFDDKGDVVEYQSVGQDITEQKEVEEAIKRSKTQLTAIIQGSPIPKFVIDKDHHVIHWNKALEGYSGILEKEIIGTNQHWRAFYKEVRPCMADLLLDGAVEKIPEWYAGKYAKSKLIDGAYEATDFFPIWVKQGYGSFSLRQ
jgi:PAS domain S-box-containing protein